MNNSKLLENAITILQDLIAFDTTSRLSNLAIIAHIQSYLDEHGVASRLTHDETGAKANLWATVGPDIAGGVVLSGHLDVVPVDGQNWSQDPFTMWQADNRLLGRGVVDMKGFIAVCLALVPTLTNNTLSVPVHFAFTYDEEVGCIGVNTLIKDVVSNVPLPRAVIVGEPTSMKIIGGHKGTRSLKTVVKGVPAHSSDPRLGVNSIMASARIVAFLESLQQQLVHNAHTNSVFDPPYTTVDLGLIQGGTAKNIIPEYTTIDWGFRLHPADDADELQNRVTNFIDTDVIPGLKKRSKNADVVTTTSHTVYGLVPDESSPAEQLIRHLTGLNASSVVSFGTEAGAFQHAGMSAVVFGPGSIKQAHQPDEFIEIDQLAQCVDFVRKLADWAADGNAPGMLESFMVDIE